MTLTFGSVLLSAGIDPHETRAIRHISKRHREDCGMLGTHALNLPGSVGGSDLTRETGPHGSTTKV